MLVGQFGDGLQFDNYFVVAHKIGQIFLAQDSPSVLQGQSRLRDCWDSAMLKFNAETFLIHGLVKATALVLVNLEAGANDRLTLILEDEIRHYFFGVIRRVWRIIKSYARTTAIRWRSSSSITLGIATVCEISSRNNAW